eukprot:5724359-Pleurochrysis_carterae.AAC.2
MREATQHWVRFVDDHFAAQEKASCASLRAICMRRLKRCKIHRARLPSPTAVMPLKVDCFDSHLGIYCLRA